MCESPYKEDPTIDELYCGAKKLDENIFKVTTPKNFIDLIKQRIKGTKYKKTILTQIRKV